MTVQKSKTMTRAFIQALLLALLLNLSGHMFLHLGDAVSAGDETHLASQQESKSPAAPQDPCSICQDHQHLSLESQAVAAVTLAAKAILPARQNDVPPSFLPAHFKPTRAPPRC